MDKINSWCKIIALISLLSSIMLLVIPESGTKKGFKALLSVILIFAFVSPLSNTDPDFSYIVNYFSSISSDTEEKIIDEYQYYPVIKAGQTEFELYFNDILNKYGAEGECEVVCEYKEEKLLLKEVKVYGLTDEEQKKIISEEIRKIGSVDTVISFSGEQNGKQD